MALPDPQLKFDYIAQVSTMLQSKEALFLRACEEQGHQSICEIQRLLFLFQRLSRAVEHREVYSFFEDVDSFLNFCVENENSLVPEDREIFLALYDHLCSLFQVLKRDVDALFDHSEIISAFSGVQNSVERKRKSLIFSIGSKDRQTYDKERAEIQKLVQDLDVLQKGLVVGNVSESSLNHLRSISSRLLALGNAVNVQKLSELFDQLSNRFGAKNFRFGFYGGEHAVDRKALNAMFKTVEKIVEHAYFKSKHERTEALFRASKQENVKLEIQFAGAELENEVLAEMEAELESIGFQVLCQKDRFAGTSISLDIPATLNSIQAQAVSVNGQQYALDLRYVKECVRLEHDNLIDLQSKTRYVTYKGKCVPALVLGESLGLGAETLENKYAIMLEVRGAWAALLVDSVGRRQAVSLRPLRKEAPAHKYFKSICFLESSLPVLLLDGKKIIIDQKRNENSLRKFLEIECRGERLAIDSTDIKEISPYEKVSLIPSAAGSSVGMMNYHGEPTLVYPLFDCLGAVSDGLKNIIICEYKGECFGLAIGENMRIKTISSGECYDQPAVSNPFPVQRFKGAFYSDGRESPIVDVEKLLEDNMPTLVKKVA